MRWDVVAHAVGLVVGEPERAVLGVEVVAHAVADAGGVDLALAAVEGVQADHAADADLVVQLELVARLHVEGLAQADVEHAVGTDTADTSAVIERLLLHRDQLALRHHLDDRHVRAFVEELGRREIQDAVVLDDDQETVPRPAHAVGVGELQARREALHLVGHAVAVAVGDGPDAGLARAHEEHVGAGRHGHVASVGHDREEIDAEARRQLDALEVGLDGVGVAAGLRHDRNVQVGGGDLHLLELVDVLLGGRGQCHGERQRSRGGGEPDRVQSFKGHAGSPDVYEVVGCRRAGRATPPSRAMPVPMREHPERGLLPPGAVGRRPEAARAAAAQEAATLFSFWPVVVPAHG